MTIAAIIGVAICSGLGAWQLQRAAWKAHVLAEIATREGAAPQPIGPVLVRAAAGEDVGFTRVTAQCGAGAETFVAGSNGTDWVWRAMSNCTLVGAPYASIQVERGLLDSSQGSTIQPTVVLPPPRTVTGSLLPAPSRNAGPGAGAPYLLVAERETPPAPGVTSVQLSQAPENLQYVGAYAPTWFGLAAVLAGVYAAALWRRLRSP